MRCDDADDATIVQAVRSGDVDAYGHLYDRYAGLVRALCYDATGQLHDAQDLGQEVFVRAFERLDQLESPSKFGAWVCGIARLACLEWGRAQRRWPNAALPEADACQTTRAAAESDLAETALHDALNQLEPRERLAMHLFYLQAESADRACQVLGLSRSGFYRMVQRARQQLRVLLAEHQEV